MLLGESEKMLQRIVDMSDRVCMGRKFNENVGKSKVMVLQREKKQTIVYLQYTRFKGKCV